MHTPCNSNVPQFDEELRVVKLAPSSRRDDERINGGTLIYMKLIMKRITRTQKKYVSYNGLKPFKCPPSSTVCLKKDYSETSIKNQQLNPYFVTGFTDAEGCFLIGIYKTNNYNIGWQVQLVFSIDLHSRAKTLLESIQSSRGELEVSGM